MPTLQSSRRAAQGWRRCLLTSRRRARFPWLHAQEAQRHEDGVEQVVVDVGGHHPHGFDSRVGVGLAQARKEFPPEPLLMRTAHAARRTGGPIQVDGRMDEPAWQAAPLEEGFTQVNPDEGEPASVHTAFRMLWDDEYFYFGAICDDPLPPTATLSRRARSPPGATATWRQSV